MEQHPVPQNVTTFQFRLIGDMTIKQFGCLAAGSILAYISYKLPLPFFFTWPLTILFAFLGFGLAFVPIEERPMDVWILSFLKSVYSPTQYVWHRIPPSAEPGITSIPQAADSAPAAQIAEKPVVVQDTIRNLYSPQPKDFQREPSFFDKMFGWVDALFPSQKTGAQPARAVSIPQTIQPATQKNEPAEQRVPVSPVQSHIADLERHMQAKQTPRPVVQKPVSGPVTAPIQTAAPPPQKGPTVKIVAPEATARAGIPRLTTFPNIVTGIVKDNVGTLLPGVLVTVRDKEGVPLRALKTNKLGQFAASTQLPDGVYVVEVEDPRQRFVFDRAQITLNGTVMPALEIAAKSVRQIEREKLSKQIFGQTGDS